MASDSSVTADHDAMSLSCSSGASDSSSGTLDSISVAADNSVASDHGSVHLDSSSGAPESSPVALDSISVASFCYCRQRFCFSELQFWAPQTTVQWLWVSLALDSSVAPDHGSVDLDSSSVARFAVLELQTTVLLR